MPMTANCVVPRGDVLELLDDIKDSILGELDDVQDVLDQRDAMTATPVTTPTRPSPPRRPSPPDMLHARAEADRILADAKAQADLDGERGRRTASRRRRRHRGGAPPEPVRRPRVRGGHRSGPCRSGLHHRLGQQHLRWKSVADGIAEQQRLVAESAVVVAAKSEADRIIDAAHAEADRLRGDCDVWSTRSLRLRGSPHWYVAVGESWPAPTAHRSWDARLQVLQWC